MILTNGTIEFKPCFYKPVKCPSDDGESESDVCRSCRYLKYTMVPHPGGGYSSVESFHCDLGYWCDDF